MRAVKVEIKYEWLRDLMDLPGDYIIEQVFCDNREWRKHLNVIISHTNFPDSVTYQDMPDAVIVREVKKSAVQIIEKVKV